MDEKNHFEKRAIEAAIKIALLALMIASTALIIKPFVAPFLWGVIIAVAVEPLVARLGDKLGGRRKLAAVLFALAVLAAIIVPAAKLISSSASSVQGLVQGLGEGSLTVPPPPAKVAAVPLVGPALSSSWTLASENLQLFLHQHGPQLKSVALVAAGSIKGGLVGIFLVVLSVLIAAALLATADKGAAAARRIARRLAGDRGDGIVDLSTATIRGVMQGVVGVALVQAVLAAGGLVVVGVPAAALWSALVLVVAVCQLPPILVLGPVAVWVFSTHDTTPATLFLVWSVMVSSADAVLKPLLMGRGVEIPMLVILLGALGGMAAAGIVGLFVGAVVLAIMYTLFMDWVDDPDGRR